ncbi:MAG: GTP 3',8-cyclase MoaA [Candidatus Tectomicrobia bacterium]|nr:GTP 3',8-cyclase MoaA [Candidatus Tectomicrobia bacterium]
MSRLLPGLLPRPLIDRLDRPLRNLRLSVTDRCNLRCQYCMPEEEYVWLPRNNVLTFEEISTLVDVFLSLGVDKVRLTGGEPLLRKDLPLLVHMLAGKPQLNDLALTTNGVILADQAQILYDAGLHRITISLDTLDAERFRALTRRDMHDRVLAGIEAVGKAGFTGLKLDTVVMRGYNDDELIALIEYGKQVQAEVRFIEYMDVGGATHWSLSKVMSRVDMLKHLSQHYGRIDALIENSSAPAQRYQLPDGAVFGIIASTTTPFCRTCDRSRLTADGLWYLCLYATQGTDFREPLRSGASAEELAAIITDGWQARRDRGAEARKALEDLGPRETFVQLENLRQDPHLEMHTRGG